MSMKRLMSGLAAASALALAACGGGDETEETNTPAEAVSNDSGADEAVSSIDAGSSNREIANAYLNEMETVVTALENVNDEASAEAAAKVLRDASERFDAMNAEMEGELDGARGMAIFGARQDEFIQMQTRMGMAMSRLAMSNPELMMSLQDEMQALNAPGQE